MAAFLDLQPIFVTGNFADLCLFNVDGLKVVFRKAGVGIGYCQLWEQYGYAGYIADLGHPYHPLWLAERLFYPVLGRIFHHDPRRPDTQKTPCTEFT